MCSKENRNTIRFKQQNYTLFSLYVRKQKRHDSQQLIKFLDFGYEIVLNSAEEKVTKYETG